MYLPGVSYAEATSDFLNRQRAGHTHFQPFLDICADLFFTRATYRACIRRKRSASENT